MKTDKPRTYWTVKSAHYGSNRYIFDTLSLAETEIARLKKQYPNEKTELTQLIEYTAVEQLEQKIAAQERVIAKLKEQRNVALSRTTLGHIRIFPVDEAEQTRIKWDEEIEQLTKESK
jgi:hypothetical protein